MEHNPIQTMLDEHDIICQAEGIIESLDKTWETDTEQYAAAVNTLITFFREYADGYHHRKEEEVLFPAINDHPDFVLQEMIDEFQIHHEDFRTYISLIEIALKEEEYEKTYQGLNNYVQDLLDHIGAENDELFVLAETLMDEEDLETIYFKFKDIDLELGEDRKRELEESVAALMV